MSGSGGSAYDSSPPQQPCERLNFKTVLSSPDPAVIAGLAPKDKLDIVLDTSGGRKKVLALRDAKIAGSITSDMLPQLIQCLEKGFPFIAEVLSAKAGRVEVHVMAGA
jgi:hypothetical protein